MSPRPSRVCHLLPIGPVLALALAGPARVVHGADAPPVAVAHTSEQEVALAMLDAVIKRFDALLALDDDARHKAATKIKLDEFKARGRALHEEFDQTRYDELRIDLNLEFQRLASWMAPPKTPAGFSPSSPISKQPSNNSPQSRRI